MTQGAWVAAIMFRLVFSYPKGNCLTCVGGVVGYPFRPHIFSADGVLT